MSQPSEQPQPTSAIDDAQLERKQNFFGGLPDDKDEASRTRRSLLFPGSIDWYVLRQFLLIFFFIVIIISAFYILMDFLNSADVFVQKCKQHNIPTAVALYQYYMPRLLVLFDAILTVCVILPGIILINQMIGRNEILALSCMGIRRVRVAYMIFISAIVLIVFFTVCREFVLPDQRSVIGSDMKSFFERDKIRVESKADPMTSVYITGESLDLAHGTIIQPVLNMPMYLNKYGQCISAEIAVWQSEQLGNGAEPTRKAGYLLKNVVAEKNMDDQSSLTINDTEILITPLNNPWLKKGECFLVSGIEIEDLTINYELQEYSSIAELRRIMERMPANQRTDAAINIHKRITRPFIDFCVIFVGLSFILANDNRFLLILIKAALWWACSWIIINMSSSLAGNADQVLTPAMAAWVPLIVFSAAAAYVWNKVFY